MKISLEELIRIAKLAKLSLRTGDEEKFPEQVSDILTFVGELKKVDVGNVESIGNITDEVNNWREDVPLPCSPEERAAILHEAPERQGDFIKVPGVFSES